MDVGRFGMLCFLSDKMKPSQEEKGYTIIVGVAAYEGNSSTVIKASVYWTIMTCCNSFRKGKVDCNGIIF